MSQLRTEQIIRVQQVAEMTSKGVEKFVLANKSPLADDYALCSALREFMDHQGFNPPSTDRIIDQFRIANAEMQKSYNAGIRFTSIVENDYPYSFTDLGPLPLVLHYIGNLGVFNNMAAVSIVGSREPGPYGVLNSYFCGKAFGGEMYNVVSGLALKCDSGAHLGAIENGGMTTAVLAHGLDSVYPSTNKALAKRIVSSGGLLLSEYMYGRKVTEQRLLDRNRLVSALSHGTLVIECTERSGTMNMARNTLEQNKLLAALQYPASHADKFVSSGNQVLIDSGKAKPIASLSDLADWGTDLNNKHYGHDTHGHKMHFDKTYSQQTFPIAEKAHIIDKKPDKIYKRIKY